MRFLLDTVTVSELCRADEKMNPGVLAWQKNLRESFLSVITLATRNTSDFKDCGISLVNPWEPGA